MWLTLHTFSFLKKTGTKDSRKGKSQLKDNKNRKDPITKQGPTASLIQRIVRGGPLFVLRTKGVAADAGGGLSGDLNSAGGAEAVTELVGGVVARRLRGVLGRLRLLLDASGILPRGGLGVVVDVVSPPGVGVNQGLPTSGKRGTAHGGADLGGGGGRKEEGRKRRQEIKEVMAGKKKSFILRVWGQGPVRRRRRGARPRRRGEP